MVRNLDSTSCNLFTNIEEGSMNNFEKEGITPTDNHIILMLRKMTQDELMGLIGIRKP